MNKILTRRIIRSTITVVIAAALFLFINQYEASMHDPAFMTGWMLFVLYTLLALFNLKKKLSFLPLGSAYSWAQIHFYGGILAAFVFLIHIDFGFPNGVFESLFAVLFIIEIFSGLFGLYISRSFPPKLIEQTENVIFERIPALRAKIISEVEILVTKAAEEMGSKAIAEFYTEKLLPYLEQHTDYWSHILNPQQVHFAWEKEFESLHRYLNENELEIAGEIQELVNTKIGLDHQYAKRSMLKRWLFLHIPVSYGLIFFILLHLILVYGFSR